MMRIQVLCDVTPWRLVKSHWCFGGTYCLHIQKVWLINNTAGRPSNPRRAIKFTFRQVWSIDHLLGKSNPITGLLQALRIPGGWDSQTSRQSAYESGMVVSPTHQPPLPPRKYSWCSFLLKTESTPGPKCGRKDYINEKFQWHNRESNPPPSGL
jgi:hypothetical protein